MTKLCPVPLSRRDCINQPSGVFANHYSKRVASPLPARLTFHLHHVTFDLNEISPFYHC